MKTYSTEAGSAETTCTGFRRPFRVLQNLQFFQSFNMSSRVSVSSPLKTSSGRPKKAESNNQSKESLSKNKLVNHASRKSVSDRNSTKATHKISVQNKKHDAQNDVQSKISESSDGSITSVGSLTSSPKWSHIKKKFESDESVSSSKSSKSTTSEPKKSIQSNRTTRNTSSGNSENVSFIHRNKYLSAKRDVDKKNDLTVNKSDTSVSSRLNNDKSRLGASSAKNETFKSTARCVSPKLSSANTPTINSSALHSSNLSKYTSGNNNSGLKTSHSPKTGSSESIKNSRCNSPNTVLRNSPTLKSSQSKFSSSNSTAEKSINSLSKNSAATTRDSTSTTIKNTHSTNTSNSTVVSKKISQDPKINTLREKEKFEDKPILAFNYTSQQTEKTDGNKPLSKLSASASEKTATTPAGSLRTNKTSKARPTSTIVSINDKSLSENVERIKDLTKNSQAGAKTIWVKDSVGNWVKKVDADAKNVNSIKTVSSSKVASLRNKFMETSKESNNIPLTKSSTTSSVPSNSVLNNRPLAKSNTLNNICDKVFIDDLGKKLTSVKNKDKRDSIPHTALSNQSNSTINDKKESQNNKTENNLKLNIVQRAVLSYEGSLALLSPETQKRLKLVTEKVQSQTDDDKILRAKTKNNVLNNSKNSAEVKSANSVKNTNAQNTLGEPVLPVRNFLNRYQQMNKNLSPKNPNKLSEENIKNKNCTKQSEARSSFLSDISSTLNKRENLNSATVENNIPKKSDTSVNSKSVTKLTMNFELPNSQVDLKSNNQENEYVLQPNSSFLWRRSEIPPSEQSKSSTASSASLTSSDYRNYYDIENYYSSLELEIEKRSENSEDHIYIDSQESNNSSENNYAASLSSNYQNISKGRLQNGSHDEWTDISDDDYRKNSVSSNQSSTLKRRKNKRYSSYRDSSSAFIKSQEQRKQQMNDTISFTDSSDTLINDEVGNESTFDMSDVNHFYEPVYESLGNYLLNQDEESEENCLSISPDEPENGDLMECSLTSLESAESNNQEKEISKTCKDSDDKNIASKKSSNKISQLKRHLSWTKNDIRFELSSKFNKIKIKKNGNNSTEIGLKMQDSENPNTSPKKKTFIKCILRQKSASSIPLKRSPSPKKESALFYVQLTMGREKQRPFSDSAVATEVSKGTSEGVLKPRKQSDSAVNFSAATKYNQHNSRSRKFTSGHTIQRPKTPPPLPPVQATVNNKTGNELLNGKTMSTSTLVSEINEIDSPFYTLLDEEYISAANQKPNPPYENDILKLIHDTNKSRTSISTSVEKLFDSDASSNRNSNASSRRVSNDLNLPLLPSYPSENMKSPFEEEPMYQFYQKDVQQRATLWYSVDGSESEFEDDVASRLSDPEYQSPKRPVLQSQLSAMDLVQGGEGGQRRLWCEVPEVIESGILKTIAANDRKIQEAMFEVITSEASYLKSLNFLIEHFVQCPEFSGDYSEKHILDKRERHILFSDIQPVRDVSVSLLADLEKRWMKYIVLSDICDILYHHASKYFSVYVKYCSNQLYQERLLRELKEKRPEFVVVLKRLESNPVCQGLDMHSFLMLPMQRITRLPLLIDAIFRRLSTDSPIYESCKIALANVNKIVAECNEGACKMQRMEEMLVISQQIDFKACKGLGLLSASRWLVKKGELVQLLMDNSNRRTFGRSSRWCKIQLYLFLFTDLLVVTRKKSDDNYSVVDYCPRNMLQVMPVDENTPPLPMRLPSSYRNVFQLIMLNNRDGKTIEMLLSCLLESDRTRWMSAVRPAKSENPDEKIYEEWDCPQVQCTHAYNAQQPDELSLEEADVVNVFKKMSDGWFEGERIRDGMRGWFPSSHSVEIINSHVRARNLHQRYRLLMLSQTYLEEQQKAQAQQAKK